MNMSEGQTEFMPLSGKDLTAARTAATATGRPFLEVLEERYGTDRQAFTSALSGAVGIPLLSQEAISNVPSSTGALPLAFAQREQCLAFRDTDGAMVVVIANPFDTESRARIEERIQESFSWRLAHSTDVSTCLKRLEGSFRAVETIAQAELAEHSHGSGVTDISLKNLGDEESFVVRLVNSTLYDAIRSDASDIHFETHPGGLQTKYRLDGVLVKAGTVEGRAKAEQVLSRIKVMAELDITERRVPQDGRFKLSIDTRPIDFRVSVMPSVHGEDAVVRVLDKKALVNQTMELRLDGLGFDEHTIAELRKLSREAYGMLLVTGPTGSGKTTTLYAAITEINTGEDKIITIEDPVEYQLADVLQIPVNEKKGLTFARGLRSILRHDPDKILVGEIRDPETAEIAVQAALTGHLVFTTVHANNVFDVIGRFTHMDVDPYSFVAAMNAIVAQRLVRLNCPECARPTRPDARLLAESKLNTPDVEDYAFKLGGGCGHCRGTGYKGRKAIAEILIMTDEIREMIVARAPARALREAAASNGTVFLRDAALALVRTGQTSLQAVNRVTLA